jgi:hypothetical protein
MSFMTQIQIHMRKASGRSYATHSYLFTPMSHFSVAEATPTIFMAFDVAYSTFNT